MASALVIRAAWFMLRLRLFAMRLPTKNHGQTNEHSPLTRKSHTALVVGAKAGPDQEEYTEELDEPRGHYSLPHWPPHDLQTSRQAINPATGQPMSPDDYRANFCSGLPS